MEWGCAATLSKHFRIIRRLAEYGFFRVGALLIGTYAFQALGNLLGVRWLSGERTLDVDFAHAGKNISLALPANIQIDAHGVLESLEMGLLPITQFNGIAGSKHRNPDDAAWRDALGRGKGWQARALQGQKALLRGAPDLADEALWHAA